MKIIHQKKLEKGCGASRWRVCNQRGLPRLVLTIGGLKLWHTSLNTELRCELITNKKNIFFFMFLLLY